MKNFIFIDIDTERDRPIIFGKPPEYPKPETQEEAKTMILNDISCLAESIRSLILMASENGYADKQELMVATVNTLYELIYGKNNTNTDGEKA